MKSFLCSCQEMGWADLPSIFIIGCCVFPVSEGIQVLDFRRNKKSGPQNHLR